MRATLQKQRQKQSAGLAGSSQTAVPSPSGHANGQQAPVEQAAVEAEQLYEELQQLFADPQHRPDIEVPGIAVIHGPPGWPGSSDTGGGQERVGAATGGAQTQQRSSLLKLDRSVLQGWAARGSRRGGAERRLGARFAVVPRDLALQVGESPAPGERGPLLVALLRARFDASLTAELAAAVRLHRQQQRGACGRAARTDAPVSGQHGTEQGVPARFLIPQRRS